ncbi:MAG TPA: DUF4911 domain-containing protein [Smithellaceae bacterium]|nr:DUF4911 domain-containing protein [Smithellaceae bacterium]HRS88372.1 DUF4911 domain-containing protein [Smithellaceae bacterium]HRV25017.1 DUF4911 domain-containing protein [Smithellaceae bacterium]
MIKKLFRIKKEDIAPVQFIVEGYEGMASVTTIDPQEAVIRIFIMAGFEDIIEELLSELKKIYSIREI